MKRHERDARFLLGQWLMMVRDLRKMIARFLRLPVPRTMDRAETQALCMNVVMAAYRKHLGFGRVEDEHAEKVVPVLFANAFSNKDSARRVAERFAEFARMSSRAKTRKEDALSFWAEVSQKYWLRSGVCPRDPSENERLTGWLAEW